MLDDLNDEILLVVSMISEVRDYECEVFLPEPVNNLLNFMLKLYSKVFRLANERFVKPEAFTANELQTECFPSLPLHSSSSNFKVDKNSEGDDLGDDDDCNKDYPRAPKMTPGLAHIYCRHGICKGFVTMTSAETPQIFEKILTRRLPQTVKSKRIFVC